MKNDNKEFEDLVDLIFTYGEIMPTEFLKKIFVKLKHRYYLEEESMIHPRISSIKHLGNEEILVNFKNGLKVKCLESSFNVIMETICKEDYHRIAGEITGTIFDVGANVGGFSLNAAMRGGVDIYAFEPDENNYKYLMENIKLNNFENKIKAFKNAIYSFNGKIGFQQDTNPGTRHVDLNSRQKVEAITLKQALTKVEKVDFLKIDVEGSEYEIFKAADREDFAKISTIVGEYHFSPKNKIFNYFNLVFLLKPYYRSIKHFATSYFLAKNFKN